MSDEVETQEEETPVEESKPIAGIGTLVFGKYDAAEVVCRDPGLAPYINLSTVGVPHTGGRHANAWFGKAKLSVVERFTNKLMRTGKYTGKKMGALKAFENALDSIPEPSLRPRIRRSQVEPIDDDLTEVSEESGENLTNNQSPHQSPLKAQPDDTPDQPMSREQTNPTERSLSEYSYQTNDLAEVSLVGEVFASQQRAAILMIVNAILLAIFIYAELF